MANTDLINEGLLAAYHDELMNTHLAGGIVFDISAYKATGTPPTLAKFANLSAALGTDGANVPESIRRGGMSVKYVQTSDNNYVQFRCISDEFTTNVSDWQGVDVEPTPSSKNLVESGGVANYLYGFGFNSLGWVDGGLNSTTGLPGITPVQNRKYTAYLKVELIKAIITDNSSTKIALFYYNSEKEYLSYYAWYNDCIANLDDIIPQNTAYIRLQIDTTVVNSDDIFVIGNSLLNQNVKSNEEYITSFVDCLSEKSIISPINTVTGKFILNGQEQNNELFGYLRYEVTGDSYYSFSGKFNRDTDIPFINWFNENGVFIHQEPYSAKMEEAVQYIDKVIKAPKYAAYLTLNYRTTLLEFSNLKSIELGSLAKLENDINFAKEEEKTDINDVNGKITDIQTALSSKSLTQLSPAETVNGKYIGLNGIEVTDELFAYRKYSVSPNQLYAFSCVFSMGNVINAISWFDSNNQFISQEPFGGSASQVVYYRNQLVLAPKNAAYLYFNYRTARESFCSLSSAIISYGKAISTQNVLPSCDLNDVKENGSWLLVDNITYQNMPNALNVGFLRVSRYDTTIIINNTAKAYILQEFYTFSGVIYKRALDESSVLYGWYKIGGDNTSRYLEATGDDTDRTSEILALLQSTGTCHLGAGTFYIDSLVMPNETSLIGCGSATKVILKTGANKFAIKMANRCSVKDMYLLGGASSVSQSVGNRHAILWQGDFSQSESYTSQPQLGIIDNVYISSFAGGGITCYDTGYGTFNHLSVTNVDIYNCDAGINVSYWSEFHKFTNVRCYRCYYGCINNGGNNVFVNCDFSTSVGVAFLMDNSQEQSPNNSHGSCIGCVFNHTANNEGVGIKILNCNNGFIFDGCQIFFSKIDIEDTGGIVFSSCNIGYSNCNITIVNGGFILITNNIFERKPPITITNNSYVHFVNNYQRYDNSLVEP